MQEDKTLQQLIREHEMNMPPEIMSLINSFDWKKEVRTVVNQNQLMIDTGADLEQSIYLMLLGAIGAPDLYERLVEAHEVPEDKAQKILEEVENQIFIPLHKKLIEMDKSEPVKDSQITAKDSSAPRDQILAEIEKEPEPLIKLNFNKTENAPAQKVEFADGADSGIVKPFTISQTSTPVVSPPAIEQTKTEDSSVKPVAEAVKDPIATNLTTPTAAINPAQAPKPYVADPYREPIE